MSMYVHRELGKLGLESVIKISETVTFFIVDHLILCVSFLFSTGDKLNRKRNAISKKEENE
jgi:hypothetical protein